MYPGHWSKETPDKPAVIMGGSGETVTYRELDDRSNRLAQLMYAAGLRRGDHIAIFMENHPRYFEVVWAGFRSGLYVTTVNRYLTGDEAAYIVDNCEARVLVSSAELREPATALLDDTPNVEIRLNNPSQCSLAPFFPKRNTVTPKFVPMVHHSISDKPLNL